MRMSLRLRRLVNLSRIRFIFLFLYFFDRFCVGDRFYLCENKILCEYDYEERLVFANMALHPPPTATLAHIKRQVTHLQPQVSLFIQDLLNVHSHATVLFDQNLIISRYNKNLLKINHSKDIKNIYVA